MNHKFWTVLIAVIGLIAAFQYQIHLLRSRIIELEAASIMHSAAIGIAAKRLDALEIPYARDTSDWNPNRRMPPIRFGNTN